MASKPNYKFMVINPLLAIELKATLKSNPTYNFNWRQKSSSLNVVQCNTTNRNSNYFLPSKSLHLNWKI